MIRRSTLPEWFEWERWRAAINREARALGRSAWMIDTEPERRWHRPRSLRCAADHR